MTALQSILEKYRAASQTEREKGTYFEELIRAYFRFEASYTDLYQKVWIFADWAKEIGASKFGISAKDTGIDLVAQTHGTAEFHAIQCKCYAPDYRVRKEDIDSFFTASGKKCFTQRIIVTTTNDWTENADDALINQQPPVYKIDLLDLENSQIDWSKYQPSVEPVLKPKYPLKPHQETAMTKVLLGFNSADRGKLIMACGTGKTLTSLKIAEEVAGKNQLVLFLVPSLNLLSQSLTEWTQQSGISLHSFAVCSDAEVGKKRKKDDDIVQTFAHELRYPATTDAKRLAEEVKKRHDAQHMSVIFSTYHSLDVISRAQKDFGLPEIKLVICDEAHRTTGATFDGEEESTFVKIHDNNYIHAAKRLYMTATPRIFGEAAKAIAEKENAELCSMNDEALYGKQFHVITFSEAVELKLLTDYKVIVLAIDAAHVSARIQSLLKDDNNQLKVDDAARIIGCWKALAKQGLNQDLSFDPDPMQRAVAFCQVIERSTGSGKHKVSSKQISSMFKAVVDAYQEQEDSDVNLLCEAKHVDGSMNASEKEDKLNWLKAPVPENTCRILSNVRCLSEGVDVPALDAVLFLTPRNSQVDVVQSVGRVMRTMKDKGNGKEKKLGYVILPVVIPAGMEPHDALNDNQVYRVVWEVLQALRSHDDRFDAFVNKLDLIGHDPRKMEVIAVTDKIEKKQPKSKNTTNEKAGKGQHTIGTLEVAHPTETQAKLAFNVGEIERALYAKVVKKCGNRNHWSDWASEIAKIANTHITRITQIVSDSANTTEVTAFKGFADELRDDLNDSITDGEVIEMLAQHLITKPVFDALFEDYSFATQNPVSQAMQQVLNVLQEHRLEKEADTLEKFYADVKMKASGINNAEGKQKIIVQLYDKFFKNAFPKMTKRLGIVYTPVEVVDFIIHSINDLLQSEFGQTLGSNGIHILDPFTGTATFITRLLQSGLIKPEELPHKYKNEIHANEIVLLAYYIAAINIEAVYHAIVGGKYEPFQGICLTDTFQLYEKGDLISNLLVNNSDRRKRQKSLDIRVIMGNPPYSAGQDEEGDGTKKVSYQSLDERIKETYVETSDATLAKGQYNSYVRAIRWASDRIGDCGIIGFVSGSGFIEKPGMDGMRQCLKQEFSKIYILNLRGDIRKNMLSKGRAKEGQNVFGSGSMSGICIILFVKNPKIKEGGQIHYIDIGDDLSQEDKFDKIRAFASLGRISQVNGWLIIKPDKHNDWIKQRDASTENFIILGDKKGATLKLFENYSLGVASNRDTWCYNSSKQIVEFNMVNMLNFYNREVDRFDSLFGTLKQKEREGKIDSFINVDKTQISWTFGLKQGVIKKRKLHFEISCLRPSLYRPFTKQWLYFNRNLNERVYQMPRIFPMPSLKNLVLHTSGVGSRSGFSVLITDCLPDIQHHDNGQAFPLFLYEKPDEAEEGCADEAADAELFAKSKAPSSGNYTRRDGISDAGLAHFQVAYPVKGEGDSITKEDLFYYIYGLLHSPDYRARFADNLSKELPRILAVQSFADFRAFAQAGRDLAHWHLNYETVAIHPGATLDTGKKSINELTPTDYRVTKMKFGKTKDATGKNIADKSTVIYNERITIKNIPLAAYDYVVNGKPALEWVMERQSISPDKDSGIVNDANLWATETMNDAKYPLELFLRVVTVSLETTKIVNALAPLN